MTGKITGIYTYEELKDKSAEEITGLINKGINENAYKTQRKNQYDYKGISLAEGIENYLI